MSMKYYKLFDLLARKGMKKTDLLYNKIISSPTLAKLSKGETVTTEVLSNICEALKADVSQSGTGCCHQSAVTDGTLLRKVK